MDVALLRWPAEERRRSELAQASRPRLLLVEAGEDPPAPADCLEDWVILPATDVELSHRVRALLQRGCRHQLRVRPWLDGDGVLRMGDAWTTLPPVESRLAGALMDRFGAVVSRDALARAGWPGGAPGRNALDVHLVRLRRRVGPVGLVIRTVRSRGYLLEVASGSGQTPVREA